MINIELFINETITDTGDNFNVRLNRQLINPAELNTKDAQYSFSISIPLTRRNNIAFGFANVEEIKGKFNKIYRAQLVINSVRIFVGYFRLSEIGDEYKGNLYIPVVKSIKDIFGDIMLNQLPEYRIPFSDFASSITAINNAALAAPQMAIFPYVLYGLLPKVPLDKNDNNYSGRDVWDNSVRINMQDVPPSINPLLMLKHIFNSQGYELGGTAFNDPRLTELYMSYRNSVDYIQPWNYGYHAKIMVLGSWGSRVNKRGGGDHFETGVFQTSDRGYNIYSANLFDCTNAQITVFNDPGGNVLYKEVNDTSGTTWAQTQIRIPASGYYKIKFEATLAIGQNANWRDTDPRTGVQHVSGDGDKHLNHMGYRVYEIKLLRDRKSGDFGISGAKLDGGFYETNQPQNMTFDENNIPKYFPQIPSNGQINFIDQIQNRKHLLGFGFGGRDVVNNLIPPQFRPPIDNMFYNPRDTAFKICQMQVGKPGLSWSSSESEANRVGVESPGYWKYGRIGTFDNEGDNPDLNIDYSGGTRVSGKILDIQGNPVDPDPDNLNLRTTGVYLSNTTGFQNFATGWEISEFIDVRNFTNLKFSAIVDVKDDAAVLVFYDENKFYIGVGIDAPTSGPPVMYTNSPITYPPGTVYVRLCAKQTTLGITGTDVTAQNVILHRFPLQKFYTYRLDGGTGYTGWAYLHEAGENAPRMEVQFINGVAQFDTLGSTFVGNPLLTIYLKTAIFDVDGTLVIDRTIDDNSSNVVGWEITDKYKIDFINSPDNYVGRVGNWNGTGQLNAVVWLDAGELLTVVDCSEEGLYRRDGMHTTSGWTNHECAFTLDIEPFRIDDQWLKVDYQGHGTAVMNWDDPVNFDVDSINLVGFLPADIKTNDFIDNFVKAYNLKLTQIGTSAFSLDVKQSKAAVTTLTVDLDGIASIASRTNTPLGLPSKYKIGFTINTEEEGYFMTGDDGGGEFNTGSIEDNVVEQKSSFSYNWFKNITKVQTGGNIALQIPVISKHDVWTSATAYSEAMLKRFNDLPTRFWYMDGILPGTFKMGDKSLSMAKVSNTKGQSILDYKNKPNSILSNYFTLLGIGSESHYTEVEAYLTPYQYSNLDGSYMVKFNNDLYYAAEIEGYDPQNKNKSKLKLIRKI
jgi:hypothetical protein